MAERIECKNCEGWGYVNHDVSQQCEVCNGHGSIDPEQGKNENE